MYIEKQTPENPSKTSVVLLFSKIMSHFPFLFFSFGCHLKQKVSIKDKSSGRLVLSFLLSF